MILPFKLQPTRRMACVVAFLLACAGPVVAQDSATAIWRGYTDAGQRAFNEGRLEEAAGYFRRALKDASELGGDGRALAVSLNNMCLVLVAQGNHAQAEPLQRRSLTMVEKRLGDKAPEVATAQVNLARILAAQGKYDEALAFFDRAMQVRRAHYGAEHPAVASVLHNLGQMDVVQGKMNDGELRYKEALAMLEKSGNLGRQNLIVTLDSYAELLDQTGRPDEAQRARTRSADLKANRTAKR